MLRSEVVMPDILIVEDNPVNQKLIAFLLARSGYTYDIADNGAAALERLSQAVYRLVLMDMMMPVMNGYDATRAIRGDSRFRGVPVIALTANAMKGEDEKCRAVGCDDYIAKPYSKDQILAAIQRLIGAPIPVDVRGAQA
jgi:CheY-like chemotaxis protein